MAKKILVVLSEWGYWGEELIGPLEAFHERDYSVSFITPRGMRPRALPPSYDPGYEDPPLGKSVTSPEMARKVRIIDGLDPVPADMPHYEAWKAAMAKPCSLAAWFPERPYWSDEDPLRAWEQYYSRRAKAQEEATQQFDGLLLVGGSGPMVDMVNNYRVHDLILGFRAQGQPIAAECYGVACLAQAREFDDAKSIIWGKHVTGHAKEYDYKDLTGVLDPETGSVLFSNQNKFVNFGPPFYTLEYMLRDATGPDGGFHGNVGRDLSVVVDYPFITGRSTPDSRMTGDMLVRVLEDDSFRRYGW